MIKVPFEQIDKEHIEQLVAEEIEEDRTLDYKRAIPDLKNTEQKRDFLKLVSSFANTVGGDILYGIEEGKESGLNTGRPEKITGLSDCNTDQIKLSMLNLIRDSIDPRIVPQVEIKPIAGFDDGPCLLVRVYRSFTSPHAVWMNKKALFYARNSGGTHPMDVTEIRNAFIGSASFNEQLRQFRQKRVELISSGQTPVLFEGGPKLIVHILPFDSFGKAGSQYILDRLSSDYTRLVHEGCRESRMRFNFDGLVAYCRPDSKGQYAEYCQVFASGFFELAVSNIGFEEGKKYIHIDIDKNLFRDSGNLLKLIKELGISPPIAFFVSFLDVNGYGMNYGRKTLRHQHYPIEHKNLLIPEIIVNSFDENPEAFLQGPFNDLWRAGGHPRNLNYDENGNRKS